MRQITTKDDSNENSYSTPSVLPRVHRPVCVMVRRAVDHQCKKIDSKHNIHQLKHCIKHHNVALVHQNKAHCSLHQIPD